MIGLIVAISANGVIGKAGTIPWRYPGDLRRFKEITVGSTVVMGRKTWESIPAKWRPLPDRVNIVVTHNPAGYAERRTYDEDKTTFGQVVFAATIDAGLKPCGPPQELAYHYARQRGFKRIDTWFIGGASIYSAALPYCDVLDITRVPDVVEGEDVVRWPFTLGGQPWPQDVTKPRRIPYDPRYRGWKFESAIAHPYEPALRVERWRVLR